MTTKMITLTEREARRLVAALDELKRDHEKRAQAALEEKKSLDQIGHPNAPIASKMATDQSELRGEVKALADRILSLFAE